MDGIFLKEALKPVLLPVPVGWLEIDWRKLRSRDCLFGDRIKEFTMLEDGYIRSRRCVISDETRALTAMCLCQE